MGDERPRNDSSRNLLEELEDGWANGPSGSRSKIAAAEAEAEVPPSPSRPSIPPAGMPNADVDALDEGWLDELFPERDEPDEDDDAPEPELPDERLDPVAFAAAKKARDERVAAKRERKKVRLAAKRDRQRAKAAALKQKQKGKTKKKSGGPVSSRRPSTTTDPDASSVSKGEAKRERIREANAAAAERASEVEEAAALADTRPASLLARPQTVASLKLLGIVLAVLVAIAAVVALLAK